MSKAEIIRLQDYKKPDFTIKTVDLVFELYEEFVQVTNMMQIVRQNESASNLVLHAKNLELLELHLGEKHLVDEYEIREDALEVFDVPDEFKLIVINKIYPQLNSELEGLYKSGAIFCTQNEPEGFRSITPYIDRPDVMALFRTTIVADKARYPLLLSNGDKEANFRLDDGRHGLTWFDPHPKPSYLFALVAGDLGVVSDRFVTKSGKIARLNIYTDRGNEAKCSHAMRSLKKAMKWDEDIYGREYDLSLYNIVAVDSFNMGAMENKGLNIFNSAYVLADEQSATDANFMGIESVIAHEYFHNWTGNRITCRDWFSLTLKEGLTVFRDQCFSADMNSKDVKRIEDVKALRERQFVEDASPAAHPIQPDSYIAINNFYTATVYEKGAEVIRMMHTMLGERKFRKGMDLYFDSFDGQAVTTDDFLWAMSSAGEIDLEQFKRWYHQSRTPTLVVDERYEDGDYTLVLRQKIASDVNGKNQQALLFPLKIALLDNDANEVVAKTIIVSKDSEEFSFQCSSKPVLSINRDFSAPINIELKQSNYSFLMKHDQNSFVRYESAQAFAIQTINAIIDNGEIDEQFVDAYGYLLDVKADLSYKALLLELPTISMIMQQRTVVDFDEICDARDRLEGALAKRYEEKLIALYEEHNHSKNSAIDAKSMGQRALKNRVLKLLSSLKSLGVAKLAHVQYQHSQTMTDKVAALDILENISSKDSAVAMEHFYEKYKQDTLVMNKYLAIIASSGRDGVLERVVALQDDAVYSEAIPNLVRALIGSFSKNYRFFHAKDGSGYQFLADKIISIDAINPQVASALTSSFRIYDRLCDANKAPMLVHLKRILDNKNISKNVYEMVSKIIKEN